MERERQQKEEAAKNEMQPPVSDSDNSDELDAELQTRYVTSYCENEG